MSYDYWTTTVDGAAGFAAQYAEPAYDDRPTLAECEADEWAELHDEEADEC